jgi:REP element-mobilizing transposase RayT
MGRGVNKLPIFTEDSDRKEFVTRLAGSCKRSDLVIYAWALMPNHFHLLLRRGSVELSLGMRRFLTGYAQWFNKKHDRVGHLFQNRYKDKIVQEDKYFLSLVRYIHMNPVKAGLLPLEGLSKYEWTGHSALMGNFERGWQDIDYVLKMLAEDPVSSRRILSELMSEKEECQSDFARWQTKTTWDSSRPKRIVPILGDPDYVDSVLEKHGEALSNGIKWPFEDIKNLLPKASRAFSVSESDLRGGRRTRRISRARTLIVWLFTEELGLTYDQIGKILAISPQAVYAARKRAIESPANEAEMEAVRQVLSELF